jgi:hypothetical protein
MATKRRGHGEGKNDTDDDTIVAYLSRNDLLVCLCCAPKWDVAARGELKPVLIEAEKEYGWFTVLTFSRRECSQCDRRLEEAFAEVYPGEE